MCTAYDKSCICSKCPQRAVGETDGSGALHTHVTGLLLQARCVARCVCVLLWVCYSLRRPGLVLRPLMVSGRGAPADRAPGLTWEHPRRHTAKEAALCVLWRFSCEVAAQLTHCSVYHSAGEFVLWSFRNIKYFNHLLTCMWGCIFPVEIIHIIFILLNHIHKETCSNLLFRLQRMIYGFICER